jgi:hypothetical protein
MRGAGCARNGRGVYPRAEELTDLPRGLGNGYGGQDWLQEAGQTLPIALLIHQ